jgi:hypothetical protein
MLSNPLTQSVEQFAGRLAHIPEADLEREWNWQSYDSEGVRFAFFRTYEELRDLAAHLARLRVEAGQPLSEAQHILGQYRAACRDLQASLLGLAVDQMELRPGEEEWPVHSILAHVLGTDIGFYVLVRYALDRLRGGVTEPGNPTQEEWLALAGKSGPALDALLEGPVAGLLAYFQENQARVIDAFAAISTEELDGLSLFWENEPYPLRFRLHRFDSHLRQHTIQIDKTRAALGLLPNETARLLRMIYGALAEVEALLIGMEPEKMLPALEETAGKIRGRLAELEEIL